MIKTVGSLQIIKCDKCGKEAIADAKNYNDVFFREGWRLNYGLKYKHLCSNCSNKFNKI